MNAIASLRRTSHASPLPSWDLITTKQMELRKRRGLMVAVALLTLALPVLVLGLRLLFHAVDPKSYGPAGSPSVFSGLTDPMAEFGFIIASAFGATAGATDLGEGMFRQLVITGRSRVALYLSRIPAGLSIVLPLVAVGFTMLCLVTAYAGTTQPTKIQVDGFTVPLHLNKAQLLTYLEAHPQQFGDKVFVGPRGQLPDPGQFVRQNISSIYSDYIQSEPAQLNPPADEMAKIGLWLELEVTIGFLVGLGLASLIGQRTVTVVLLIALEIIVTPILAMHVIPYFINGQRLIVGVAMDQLRPASLASGLGGGGGGGRGVFGGRGALGIPPMPTWAMVAVIVGWTVGWTVIGAYKMATRDA